MNRINTTGLDKQIILPQPFLYQWILPSGFIQYIWGGPLYILRGHRLKFPKILYFFL